MSAIPAAQSKCVSASVFTLQSHEIDDHWFWIERLLMRIEGAPWKPEHVRSDLKVAKAQAWVLGDSRSTPVGIVITRIENVHDERFGLLWIAAGEGIERAPLMLDAIEPWFKQMGCTRSEIIGRRGWERALPDYEFKSVLLAKELQ